MCVNRPPDALPADRDASSVPSPAERIWRAARADPSNAQLNIPLAFRVEGPLDTAALEQALNNVVRRHDALRTVF